MKHRGKVLEYEGTSPLTASILMVVIALVLAMILHSWAGSFLQQGESAPTVQMDCTRDTDGSYQCKVIQISHNYKGDAFSYFLKDPDGLTLMFGPLRDIYGFGYGHGKGVTYDDADRDGKLTTGDSIHVYPGDPGTPLEAITDMDEYRLEIKFHITDDVIGSFKLGA